MPTLFHVEFLLNAARSRPHTSEGDCQVSHFAWAETPEQAIEIASGREGAFVNAGDEEVARVQAIPSRREPGEPAYVHPNGQRFLVTALEDGVTVEPL
jgi:hypothetical protein